MKTSCGAEGKSGRGLLHRPVQWLFRLDELVHILVALTLVVIALCILGHTIINVKVLEIESLLKAVNMVLLVLIVMELLWPVLTFLKKAPFSLNPFIYICIISSIRRILLVEAEMSIGNYDHDEFIMEMGISVGTILVMIIVHYIYNKCCVMRNEADLLNIRDES